jgi:hypothetical protein
MDELEEQFNSLIEKIKELKQKYCSKDTFTDKLETIVKKISVLYKTTIIRLINSIIKNNKYHVTKTLIDIINEKKESIIQSILLKKNNTSTNTDCNVIINKNIITNFIMPFNKYIKSINEYIISIGVYESNKFNIDVFENADITTSLSTETKKTTIETINDPKYNFFITVGKMFKPTIGAMAFGNKPEELKKHAEAIYNKMFDTNIKLPDTILFIGFGEIGEMDENKLPI